MIKYRFYVFIALGLALVFFITAAFAANRLIKSSTLQVLENQLESSSREATEIATLVKSSLDRGITKEEVVRTVQKSIENTDQQKGFVSVIDWSGKMVCYPDITKVGQEVSEDPSIITSIENIPSPEEFYELVIKANDNSNANSRLSSGSSEVVFLIPVEDTDWLIGSHINTTQILLQQEDLKSEFYTIFMLLGFVMIFFSLIFIRLLGSNYERQLELKSSKLEDGVLNLSKLNASLENYQKNLSANKVEISAEDETTAVNSEEAKERSKQRILTYFRNELLPVSTDDIAYIYVDNTITYIVRKDGKRSTSNDSLDQIFSSLDEKSFFRANRQIIVAISAIDKITKFGNSKLKIQVVPSSEIDIIIGKNKAAAFKQWLDL